MRRNRRGVALIGLAVLVIIGIQVYNQLVMAGVLQKYRPPTPAEKTANSVLDKVSSNGDVGAASAPIQVLVYVPLIKADYGAMSNAVIGYVKAHSEQVHLKVLDKSKQGTDKEAISLGATLDQQTSQVRATVLVNRKSTFTLKGPDGKARTATFLGQPGSGGPSFTADDVIQAIEQEAAKRK